MSQQLLDKVRGLFPDRFGKSSDGVAFAPGRVNLIGEHVDYNEGLVLPMPVMAGTSVAWSRRNDDKVVIVSADFGEEDSFDLAEPSRPDKIDWRSYCRGMFRNFVAPPCGMNILIAGNLPKGSGLSSSASLCIALGRAMAMAAGRTPDTKKMAIAGQRTEYDYAGVACGIMDQMAVAAGIEGHAMLLDCRNLSFQQIAIPDEWAIITVDSGTTRELREGEYNKRRQQCANAAKAMAVHSLRDANLADILRTKMSEVEAMRARHVIEEIERVSTAARAIENHDLSELGLLFAESHKSLRDYFEVSHPKVDTLVAELQSLIGSEGGARMTGAGFGGSVVAVLHLEKLKHLASRLSYPIVRVR